jgi:hypothetical protein
MAAGDLVTSAVALSWLGLPVDDGTVAALVTAASTAVQNFIGYQLASATYTRTFNGANSDRILLPDRPVTAVTAVTIDTIAVPQAVLPTPGFLWDSKFVYLAGYSDSYRGYGYVSRFNRGIQNIVVTYTAGYASIPGDIVQACLMWLTSLHAQFALGADASVKLLRAGDSQIEFGSATAALQRTTILLPPSLAALLMPYRRVAT